MKTSNAMFVAFHLFVGGTLLGYRYGVRQDSETTAAQMISAQLEASQRAEECEARGYLYSLQALDANCDEEVTRLRVHALSHIRSYVRGVQDLRAAGYNSPSGNKKFYTNAVVYLAEHSPKS